MGSKNKGVIAFEIAIPTCPPRLQIQESASATMQQRMLSSSAFSNLVEEIIKFFLFEETS